MHPLKVALKKIDDVSNRAAVEAERPVAIDVGAALLACIEHAKLVTAVLDKAGMLPDAPVVKV